MVINSQSNKISKDFWISKIITLSTIMQKLTHPPSLRQLFPKDYHWKVIVMHAKIVINKNVYNILWIFSYNQKLTIQNYDIPWLALTSQGTKSI